MERGYLFLHLGVLEYTNARNFAVLRYLSMFPCAKLRVALALDVLSVKVRGPTGRNDHVGYILNIFLPLQVIRRPIFGPLFSSPLHTTQTGNSLTTPAHTLSPSNKANRTATAPLPSSASPECPQRRIQEAIRKSKQPPRLFVTWKTHTRLAAV